MLQIGDNIQLIRKLSNLSQKEFAEKFSVLSRNGEPSEDKISNIERNRTDIDEALIVDIAEFAGVSVADLKTKSLKRGDIKFKSSTHDKVITEVPKPVKPPLPSGDELDKLILYNLSESSRTQSEALKTIADAHKILALRTSFPGVSLADMDKSNEARIQTLTEYVLKLGSEVRGTDEKSQVEVLDTIESGVLNLYSNKGSGDNSGMTGKQPESVESSVGS